MKVRVKLIATYREHLPPGTQGNITEVDVAPGTTVREVLTPSASPWTTAASLCLTDSTVPLETPVTEGDTVAAFSAIAGG